jgi:hypothetical protein
MNRASRLLHDPTSFASPPPPPATRCDFQQLTLKPRGAFQTSISTSDVVRTAGIDGSASALRATENAGFGMGVILCREVAASQHTIPRLCEGLLNLLCSWPSVRGAAAGDHEQQNFDSGSRRIRSRLLHHPTATRRCVVRDTEPPSAQGWTDRTSGHTGGMRNL